jgi:hypothetical protein
VHYECVGDTAVFFIDNPKSDRPSKRKLSLVGLAIPRSAVDRLFDAVCRQTQGLSRRSKDSSIDCFLRPFLAFFRQGQQTYPVTSADWQMVLVNFLRFVLIDRSFSKKSVRSRIQNWRSLAMPVFSFWIEEDIIPCDVQVPGIDSKGETFAAAAPPLLGCRSTQTVVQGAPVRKLLVDVGFAQTDADFLLGVECECQEKIATLRRVCLKHWSAMRADHQTGTALASQITASQIDERLREGRFRKRVPGSKYTSALVTSTDFSDGHVWALAIAKRFLNAGEGSDCISLKVLRGSRFFKGFAFSNGTHYPALFELSALPACAADLMTKSTQLYRFLSILSGVDVAAACVLLMMEHPQFTSSSLQNAQLLNVRGRSYLEATDDNHSARFSLDKPRAGVRKSAVLSPLAQQIVTYVIEVTAPLRTRMRHGGHKAWRYLFLGQQLGGHFGPFRAGITLYLTKERFSLIRLYPELVDKGLTRGTLDFRRLRNTLGVLRWFATGSIVEMSRCLGNTYKVALEHYLPPALLQAWTTRIVRRFQNTLIVLAAHEEDYMLAVTDFSTLGDLLHFMAQLIHDHRDGDSPIATEIHTRLGARSRQEAHAPATCRDPSDERLLNLRCSSKALAYLYAFAEYAAQLGAGRREQVDPSSGLCAQSFIELARMIRHACEDPHVSASMRELLDIEQLRCFHQAALAQQADLRVQFSRFSLSNAWGP